jgi:cytidine deaminase
VREAFPLADVIVNASDEADLGNELNRFFEILFGHPTRSPTLAEYGMALAFSASVRSIDMARQVGAAIVSKNGETLALGCNEVPKAWGGTYWEGDTGDARDASLGEDQNTRRKRHMVIDVVYRLAKANLASKGFLEARIEDLENDLIDKKGAPLKDAIILDSLEFGRMLHAEMCAISEAARLGIPLKGHTLYCTTFPCHNCAKHIVGVGIDRVVYLQPFPKSHVSELYPDSIDLDSPCRDEKKVAFSQYIGLAPARYYLFEKSRLKDASGKIKRWEKNSANPISRQAIPLQSDVEKFALSTFEEALQRIKPPAS